MRDPIVTPIRVTETETAAGIVELIKVITIYIELKFGGATAPKTPPLIATVGVELEEKNPNGNESVMLLLTESSPPADGVKENVAEDPILPATRSPLDIMKEVFVTLLPIGPEGVPKEELMPTLVEMKIPRFVPGNTRDPMVSPDRVTETVEPAAIAALEVVITIEVAVGAAAIPCASLLIKTEGVKLVLKKPTG